MNELVLMQQDSLTARTPYKVEGPLWPRLNRQFSEHLQQQGIHDVETQQFNASFASYGRSHRKYKQFTELLGGQVPLDGDWYRSANQTFLTRLLERDKFGILARSIPTSGGMTIDLGTRKTSWDYLLSVDELISIAEVRPQIMSEPQVIVDLGSGWGRIGHTLLQVNPRATYVACDLPESLFIAQTYLPRHLHGVNVVPFSDNRNVERFTEELLKSQPGMRFCGPQHLDKFDPKSVDVFINVFSFQEMTNVQTTLYFETIERVAQVLYMQQRVYGNGDSSPSRDPEVMSQDNYPYGQAWEKLYERPVSFSPNFFEIAVSIR